MRRERKYSAGNFCYSKTRCEAIVRAEYWHLETELKTEVGHTGGGNR
jgi:hypothetical protein